jgi:hypothetical protein
MGYNFLHSNIFLLAHMGVHLHIGNILATLKKQNAFVLDFLVSRGRAERNMEALGA